MGRRRDRPSHLMALRPGRAMRATTSVYDDGPVAAARTMRGCRVVTTSESARLLLMSQLLAMEDIEWSVVSGDAYPDSPPGIAACHIPMRREFALSDPAAFVKLWRFFRCHDVDFVQTHTPKASFLGLPAARLAGKRAAYTMHGAMYFRGNPAVRNIAGWVFEWWCCRWAHVVLLQSEEDMSVIPAARICRSEKMVYVGNGIDVERFSRVPAPDSGDDRVTVLMISRLVSEKGCRDFFEAARRLQGQARFVHVGPAEPDQSDAIGHEEIAALANAGLVDFVGRVSDVGPYLQDADIVVLPSYREGIPRAAMEAAAAGRPVVAYDIRGVREVIPPSTGLLVRRGDVTELEFVLRGLIADPERRLQLGRTCHDWVLATFSEDQVVRRLRDAYRHLVGTR